MIEQKKVYINTALELEALLYINGTFWLLALQEWKWNNNLWLIPAVQDFLCDIDITAKARVKLNRNMSQCVKNQLQVPLGRTQRAQRDVYLFYLGIVLCTKSEKTKNKTKYIIETKDSGLLRGSVLLSKRTTAKLNRMFMKHVNMMKKTLSVWLICQEKRHSEHYYRRRSKPPPLFVEEVWHRFEDEIQTTYKCV